MLKLKDEILLYHGSYTEVSNIDLSKCESGKDFGKGFYLTTSYAQAQHFIPLSVRKYNFSNPQHPMKNTDGRVSVYKLHLNQEMLNTFYFEDTNADWLHFISSNRKIGLFPELKAKYHAYDIIAGKIANDKTSTVISAYMGGAYGPLENETAISIAIQLLLPNKLENQYCFITEKAIQTLEFLRSEPYDPNI